MLEAVFIIASFAASNVFVTGPSIIDELRLHLADAAMDTYTYEPVLGVSSHCDERNNIIRYEYDEMRRLQLTRDINNNIISMSNHTVNGTDH